MNFRWMIRRLHRWGFSRHKLRGGFLHTRLGDRVLDRDLWLPTRGSIARAWLVGMPVTTVPFLPAQSVIACAIGFFARANLPLCFLLQFLSSPATAVIQLPACYLAGCLVLGRPVAKAWDRVLAHPTSFFSGHDMQALFIGAFVLGPILGAIGYGLTMLIWRDRPRPARFPAAAARPLPSIEGEGPGRK